MGDADASARTDGASRSDAALSELFSHLAAGGSLDEFLRLHPDTTRVRAVALLECARSYWRGDTVHEFGEAPTGDVEALYQQMCREFSAADFARCEEEQIRDAQENGLSFDELMAELCAAAPEAASESEDEREEECTGQGRL